MKNKKDLELLICGVGGQGVVLMSELLGEAAVRGGVGVKGSEVLGMAQRGGSVYSNIRLGSAAHAAMTMDGTCDVLLAVEPSEALRHTNFLSEESVVVLNTSKVLPFTVFLGTSGYPELEDILAKLRQVTENVVTLDAAQIAEQAGSLQSANVVMLGALFGTGLIPVDEEAVKTAVRARLNAKVAEMNIKAFDMGCQEVKQALRAAPVK